MKLIKVWSSIFQSMLIVYALAAICLPACHKKVLEKPAAKMSSSESIGNKFSLLKEEDSANYSNASDPIIRLKNLLSDENIDSDIGKRDEAIQIIRSLAAQKRMDAVPLFLDGLILIRPSTVSPGSSQFALFPCAEALIEIGAPAIPQIEDKFFSLLIPREQFLAFETLLEIRGSVEIAEWLDALPETGPRSLSAIRRQELKSYALSLEKMGHG